MKHTGSQRKKKMVAHNRDEKIEKYYNATAAAQVLGCSRSSVCRAAKANTIGIFAGGRLAALTRFDIEALREHLHASPGNPMWIAAAGTGRRSRRRRSARPGSSEPGAPGSPAGRPGA